MNVLEVGTTGNRNFMMRREVIIEEIMKMGGGVIEEIMADLVLSM
jgi:hypothetical protein